MLLQEDDEKKEMEKDRVFSRISSLPLPDVSRIKSGARIPTTSQYAVPQTSVNFLYPYTLFYNRNVMLLIWKLIVALA